MEMCRLAHMEWEQGFGFLQFPMTHIPILDSLAANAIQGACLSAVLWRMKESSVVWIFLS